MATPQQELVRRAVEAYNDRDAERIVSMSQPDLVWKPMTPAEVDGTTYEGHEGAARYLEDLGAVWESMRVDIDELRGDGDRIVLLGRLVARGRGSHAEVESPTAMLIEVRDGLLARCETYRTLDELPE